jgi:15-cis-phytoene desaturase
MPVDRYSMYNLMGLFMPYLKSMHKLRVGAFTGGMTEVMMQPMADYVVARGGEIHTNAPVDRLYIKKDEVCGAFAAGKKFCAKRVVLAASLAGAQKILKRSIPEHLYIQDMLHMPSMPAVTFQIELTEPSMTIDRTTFGPGTALTSFTEQSRTTFSASKGRLSIILSPPERFIDLSDDQILEVVLKDAKKLGLQLEGKIVSYRSVRLPADFYSLAAGSEALRPPQDIGIPNLVLAGDYTKQPYLATMEGAVVSGKLAADLLMKNIV